MQRCGVTVGTEVHRCLGGGNRRQYEVELLCIWSGDIVPIGDFSFFSAASID